MAYGITLHLVLTIHWFTEMVNGTKDIEYREMSPHWKRLIWDRREKITHARFSRAYSKTTILREVVKIDIGPCPYDSWPGDYYRIHMEPFKA